MPEQALFAVSVPGVLAEVYAVPATRAEPVLHVRGARIMTLDMDFTEFEATLDSQAPPESLTLLLRALWLDKKGDFAGAHSIAQDVHTEDGARVHAYLHRKEGDLPNAQYWYGKAHCQAARGSLEAEWEALVRRFL